MRWYYWISVIGMIFVHVEKTNANVAKKDSSNASLWTFIFIFSAVVVTVGLIVGILLLFLL